MTLEKAVMHEMRKHGRVPIRCPAVVKVLNANDAVHRYGPPRYGHTADCSAGGMRLVLGEYLPLGAAVEVIVVLLNPPSTFRHQGLVCWSKSSDDGHANFVGIDFTASSPAVMQVWARMLAERYPFVASKPTQFAKETDSIW